jgi:hypothetical protein
MKGRKKASSHQGNKATKGYLVLFFTRCLDDLLPRCLLWFYGNYHFIIIFATAVVVVNFDFTIDACIKVLFNVLWISFRC